MNQWKPVVYEKSKSRSSKRIFIKKNGERIGYFRNLEEAQKECDKLNKSESSK